MPTPNEFTEFPKFPRFKQKRYKLRPFPEEVLVDVLVSIGCLDRHGAMPLVQDENLTIISVRGMPPNQLRTNHPYTKDGLGYWIPIEVCEEIKEVT